MDEPLDYIGVKPCGCVPAWVSWRVARDHPRDLAKTVAKWIRDGWGVERCTTKEARTRIGKCPHGKPVSGKQLTLPE